MPDLRQTLDQLDAIAPLRLSASWDNTGLLLEGDRTIARALVTIDLTPSVLDEAIAHDVDLVIAYHPPIFRGMKALTRATTQGRTLLALARRGVHVYSPHTALDSVVGGLNDWLLECFGEVTTSAPIEPDLVEPSAGVGRIATVAAPCTLGELVPQVKSFLGLPAVRVAGEDDWRIGRIAVCPGAGGSVFEGLSEPVDLLLTGEMRHHDVLAFRARRTATILTDHTNTERGYLPRYAGVLRERLGIEVVESATDADPLTVR